MKIDGRAIAQEVLSGLREKILTLKKQKNTAPHIAIILLGENPASKSYIKLKMQKADEIGAKATLFELVSRIKNNELRNLIEKLNDNALIHGIIVQRPLPRHIDVELVDQAVDPKKDIDAFHPKSPFEMPLAKAVLKILENVFTRIHLDTHAKEYPMQPRQGVSFASWLRKQKLIVIGKGKTGGGPVIKLLRKTGIEPTIIDSKTANPDEITKNADVLISTVGKSNLIKSKNIKKGVLLIGVGMYRGEDGKMHGDYNEKEIEQIASYYTPIPGGVGPVNVAMLLENLVVATEKQLD